MMFVISLDVRTMLELCLESPPCERQAEHGLHLLADLREDTVVKSAPPRRDLGVLWLLASAHEAEQLVAVVKSIEPEFRERLNFTSHIAAWTVEYGTVFSAHVAPFW